MKTSLLLIASVVLASRAAMAAPAAPVPPAEPPMLGPPSGVLLLPPSAPLTEPPRGEKSPMLALSLTIGVPTLGLLLGVPLASREGGFLPGATLVAASLIVGPSAGWFYAGRPLHGLATTGIRLAGGALLFVAWAEGWSGHDDRAWVEAAGAVTLIFAATIADLAGPVQAITRDNERARRAFVPIVHAGGGGLAIAGSF